MQAENSFSGLSRKGFEYKISVFGDRSFRQRVVSPTSRSVTSQVVSLTKQNEPDERYTCIYLVLS